MWRKLSYLFRRKRFNGELDDEIRFHLEMAAQERGEAAARREFGSVVRMREDTRSAWQVRWLVDLGSDLRYALRALRRNPGFAAAAIFSLALGIGANTTIFSLTMEFLFSQPSCRNPETLAHMEIGGNSHAHMPHYRFLRDAHIFEGLAGSFEEAESNWRFGNDTYRLHTMRVTENFFRVVGVPVAMGRPIEPGDGDVVVLSDRFWKARLASDPNIIGKALIIDGRPYRVSGVLPHNHRTVLGFGFSPDLYIPASRESDVVALIARLPEGMSFQAAHARLVAACKQLDKAYPNEWGPKYAWSNNVEVVPVAGLDRLKQLSMIPFTAFFGMLMIVVGLVLMIACVNVSSLLLARASARRQELAIRLAIGAGRGRIVRQLLAESLLLALLGTCAGLLLNIWLSGVMNRVQLPLPIPLQLLIQPDWRLLLYSTVVAAISALVAGLMPALKATREGVSAALKLTERQVGRWTLRNALVVGQLAVSVVLLTTGFLFVRNMTKSMTMSLGFDSQHTVWAHMRLVPEKYTATAQTQALAGSALSELRTLPGVEAASIASVVPLNNNDVQGSTIRTDLGSDDIGLGYHDNFVAPDYFRTMGIPLSGRDFLPSDRNGVPEVAILNENLAHRLFGNQNPVGHTFRYTETRISDPVTVIGVAKNSKYFTLGEENQFAMYWPYLQMDRPTVDLHFLVRAARPRDVLKEVAQTLGRLDTSAAVEVKPMRDAMGFAFLPSRVGAALLGSMGLLGLALASIGLYGVLAYSVARRTREIGLRVALGADRAAVLRMVARESFGLLAIGLAIGLGISIFATKPLAMFLVPELSPTDPATFLTVVAVLGTVAFAATLGPALRALRVDPMVALRYE
ncbi:MAG TPA: ABC transporter permease [Bryobacteraceae bacterium]|nr:ABC transporter permease [Bryobacteraceae bacterium]